MKDLVLEVGKSYRIIYDDKGFKPVQKRGVIVSKEDTLIRLDSGEVLNTRYVIRVIEEARGGV